MGMIYKELYGKDHIPAGEANIHADVLCEVLKTMPNKEKGIIHEQRDMLKSMFHGLGEKGAVELLGKLGMWMVLNDVHSVR